ncbi:hypothetical protein Tco_0105099 [Tanacetum coccineum]
MSLGSLDLTLVVAIPTVLVLVPTILIVGLAVVLHGRKTGWSDLVCHWWRTVTGISLVEIGCGCLRDVFLDVISVIVAIGSWTITIDVRHQAGKQNFAQPLLRERELELKMSACRECSIAQAAAVQHTRMVEVWDDIPTLHLGFVLGGKNGVWVGTTTILQLHLPVVSGSSREINEIAIVVIALDSCECLAKVCGKRTLRQRRRFQGWREYEEGSLASDSARERVREECRDGGWRLTETPRCQGEE